MAEEEAARRARRPPPERAREDDRIGVFGPAETRRAGLDAAALGGARRKGTAARLRQARGAGAGREARRPVRARASRGTGARAGFAFSARVKRAVVIGSGPNGLAGAIALARAGLEVVVHEAEPQLGGGMRSAELTLPGFVHDVCSSIHPLGADSPFFRELDLDVDWIHPDAPAAHPFDDGSALLLEPGLEATADGLGRDGDAYRRLVGPLVESWCEVERVLLGPLPLSPSAVLDLRRRLGTRGLVDALRAALSAAR